SLNATSSVVPTPTTRPAVVAGVHSSTQNSAYSAGQCRFATELGRSPWASGTSTTTPAATTRATGGRWGVAAAYTSSASRAVTTAAAPDSTTAAHWAGTSAATSASSRGPVWR